MEIHINCVNLFAIVQLSIRSFISDNINNRKNKEQVSSLYKEGQINKKNPHVVKTFLYFRECLQIQISVHTKKTTEDKTRLAPWRKNNIVLLSEKYSLCGHLQVCYRTNSMENVDSNKIIQQRHADH